MNKRNMNDNNNIIFGTGSLKVIHKKHGGHKHKKKDESKNLARTEKTNDNNINYTNEEIRFLREEYPKLCNPYKYVPAILKAKPRIIVFGDIHGDYSLTLDLFTKAGLITFDNNKIIWSAGDTYVVQVGDQIDRCRPLMGMPCTNPKTTYNDEASDIKIMELFNDLSLQADKVGGAVISLLGNHELLNALGQMFYVSHLGLKQFDNYVDPDSPNRIFKDGMEARIHAFQPGNNYARMMGCTRMACVIIGSNLFVHAGIIDALIKEIKLKGLDDLERINIKIRRWLLGLLDQNYVEHIIKFSENSMFWSRVLGKIPPGTSLNDTQCMDNIKNVLNLFQIGSMIIGHTPQSFTMHNEGINSTCDQRIWRADNGSSAAFNNFDNTFKQTGVYASGRRTQYLEILDDCNFFICDCDGCKKEIRL
jgi:hypothetical protein